MCFGGPVGVVAQSAYPVCTGFAPAAAAGPNEPWACTLDLIPLNARFGEQMHFAVWPLIPPYSAPAFIRPVRKKVLVNIHVWQFSTTTPFNFQDTSNNRTHLTNVISRINDLYASVALPSDPIEPLSYYTQDTRIGVELNEIHFHVDPIAWALPATTGTSTSQLTAIANELVPGNERYLNLHIVGTSTSGAGATPPPVLNDFATSVAVASIPLGDSNPNDGVIDPLDPGAEDDYVVHWAHELGHTMGLKHVYAAHTNNALTGQEPCESFPDHLPDIFPPVSEMQWCYGPGEPGPSIGCDYCFFSPLQGDPVNEVQNRFTNNLMGNNSLQFGLSLTPYQTGRMHRTLMTTSVSQYAVVAGPPEPLIVAGDETWDWRMKVYQNIIVQAGHTLTIKCELQMVPGAMITVEPGARLIIDGGKVTVAKFSDERWTGIQLLGNPSGGQESTVNPPYLDHQALLELRNGAIIEHAGIGVFSFDAGPVITINGTPNEPAGTFVDCKVAIAYNSYLSPTGSNASLFNAVRFERTPNYLPDPDAGLIEFAFVLLGDVNGFTFKGCSFTNDLPGVQESFALGNGISAMNSEVAILPFCPDPDGDCPPALEEPSLFDGLDQAMAVRSSGSGRRITIRKANFTNNIAGVYANGQVGLSITQCDFTLGNNPVALTHPDELNGWNNFHRGIYTYNSWGLRINDNTLSGDPAGPGANTEGIVIGYSRDHNDVVYKNEIEGLYRAFIGEGICAEVENGQAAWIGLQFRCNTNTANDINIWSRMVQSANEFELPKHTIRTNQGYQVAADNLFDDWEMDNPDDNWNYYIDTDWRIRYRYRNTDPLQPEYIPSSYDPEQLTLQGIYRPNQYNPFCLWYYEQPNVPRTAQGFGLHIAQEKLAYANTRYLYDELLDGGSTDEVVQEISSTWPNEAWELRSYLLGLSPYLSEEVLRTAVNKAYFPMAMKAEVCIANPDATKAPGFITFLEEEAHEPMPAYLVDLIKASWDTKTYRTELEMEMADRHTELTQTVHALLDLYSEPGSTATVADQRWAWQQIRTTAARYAEAGISMGNQEYGLARTVVEGIPTDHVLKDAQWAEQQRMLDYIAVLETAHLDGRGLDQLNAAEVAQLRGLRGTDHDRASNWINNLLCHYYHDCLPPHTGGGPIAPKSLRPTSAANGAKPSNEFLTAPNPAEAWVTFTYTFRTTRERASVSVQDALGREVAVLTMPNEQGQLVLDTRDLGAGLYTVSYINAGVVEQLDKLVVR